MQPVPNSKHRSVRYAQLFINAAPLPCASLTPMNAMIDPSAPGLSDFPTRRSTSMSTETSSSYDAFPVGRRTRCECNREGIQYTCKRLQLVRVLGGMSRIPVQCRPDSVPRVPTSGLRRCRASTPRRLARRLSYRTSSARQASVPASCPASADSWSRTKIGRASCRERV